MGKGDKKTRKGKIYAGSHGNVRPHSPKSKSVVKKSAAPKPAVRKAAKPASKPAAKPAAKAAPAKKAPARKAAAKKSAS